MKSKINQIMELLYYCRSRIDLCREQKAFEDIEQALSLISEIEKENDILVNALNKINKRYQGMAGNVAGEALINAATEAQRAKQIGVECQKSAIGLEEINRKLRAERKKEVNHLRGIISKYRSHAIIDTQVVEVTVKEYAEKMVADLRGEESGDKFLALQEYAKCNFSRHAENIGKLYPQGLRIVPEKKVQS